jgi:3-oxoacyl-[acyl-carrier-protein] synthase II
MSLAVAASRLSPDDISCVIAEGQATEHADRAEARAIHRAFGDRQDGGARSLPVTAPRSMYGHAVAGAGALDAASASLALRHGAIPPTINVEPQDPECDLNLVRDRGREAELDAVLIGNRGLGGVNSALVIRRLD